ncbi:unnamed protein product [Lota lota]
MIGAGSCAVVVHCAELCMCGGGVRQQAGCLLPGAGHPRGRFGMTPGMTGCLLPGAGHPRGHFGAFCDNVRADTFLQNAASGAARPKPKTSRLQAGPGALG